MLVCKFRLTPLPNVWHYDYQKYLTASNLKLLGILLSITDSPNYYHLNIPMANNLDNNICSTLTQLFPDGIKNEAGTSKASTNYCNLDELFSQNSQVSRKF